MINIHKYEMIGIGVSVALMSLALFFMRVNGTFEQGATANVSGQAASVVLAENSQDGLNQAFSSAMSMTGRIDKLVITDVVLGNGGEAKKGDQVTVNYIGTLQNGQEFDNTYKKGSPVTFTIGDSKVIDGWNEGVVGMKAGGQRIIVVPADMAYGREGYGPIPANATLVYAIELVSVK